MKFHQNIFITYGLSAILSTSYASGLSGSVTLGYVGAKGNTDTDSYNFELLGNYETETWEHNAKIQALGSQENAVVNAERYFLELKSDYFLQKSRYLYGKINYNDDRFSGFNYQLSASVGYGTHVYPYEDMDLELYVGVGARQNEENTGVAFSEVIVSIGEKLEWKLNQHATFKQSLESEFGDKGNISVFEIALESQIIANISSKLAFQARYNSNVPQDKKKVDTLTTINLGYLF